MQRRSHKKSRRGCAGCKRRHIKCDETQPECSNCTTAGIECAYASQQPLSENSLRFVASSPKQSSSPSNAGSPGGLSVTRPLAAPSVNLLHLELFHHFVEDAGDKILAGDNVHAIHPYFVKTAITSQFLMTEILAISALHLGLSSPERGIFLRNEAGRLQNEALLMFNTSVKEITTENAKAAFLYSGMLGIHFFCNTFSAPSENIEVFLDRLIQSIRLLRGVLAILSGWYDYLLASDLGGMIREGRTQMSESIPDETNETIIQFEQMRVRLASCSLDQSQSEVCQKALQQLIKVWWSEVGNREQNSPPNSRTVTSWPVMVSAEFADLLMQRKPEALSVLGYYAVLLHQCKKFWAVGEGGRLLLGYVGEYLGTEWDSWLEWPRSVIFN